MQGTGPACRLCAGASRPAFMAGEHRMYRCDACRSTFVSPVPSPDELTRFYDRYHLGASQGGWYDEVEGRMQADFPAKIAMVRHACGGSVGRLLDVGCGKGYFVRACADAGLAAEGIDLSESGVKHATEQLKVKAIAGDIHAMKAALGVFDCVTFWATIEHLPDPIQTLRDIADVLRPGGRVFLDTGIGDDWLDRTLPGRVQWYDPPQHLFVFSAAGMKVALEKAGFKVERFEPNFERTPVRRLVKSIRNGGVALGLRLAAEVGRASPRGFTSTRFPLGNLMSVAAVKQ